MNLVIDTAHAQCGVGLFEDGHLVALQDKTIVHGHAAVLPGMIREVVSDFTVIRNIIVDLGPGSFTGIRVGLAYAKGLAKGLNVPLFGVNAFQAYAQSLEGAGLVLIDAKRKDIYGQHFTDHAKFLDAFNLTPEEIAERFDLSNLPCVGNGVLQLENELGIKLNTRKAEVSMVELLYKAFLKGMVDPKAEPYYLRSADVTIGRN